MSVNIENINRVQIRVIKFVVDLEDPFSPELTLEDYIKRFKEMPKSQNQKIFSFEIVTCSEDNHPVLITECGQCKRFIRRFNGEIICRKFSL